MREYLLQLKTQTIELWQRMTRIQRIILGCSAVLLIGTLVLLARGATKPDYGALFTQLDDQSAGQIVQKLKEMKISYQLSDGGSAGGGTTILVPTKDIDQTRIDLAGAGMPTGGVVGFESFDTTKFGETDTDRRARYLRALQGELTRTIEGMAEVDKARVHIVLPEPSLFMDEQKNATAAVMLKLKPNQTLDEGQVMGLVKLISNSVEGLKPENVTIVDMSGNNLTEDIPADQDAKEKRLTTDQIDMQKQLQKEIQGNVQSMLERIFGLGKAVVRMQMQLDFDKIQKKSQEWGPNKVVRSQSVTEKTSNNSSANNTGVPGTDSNIPGYTTPVQTGNSQTAESEKITNNEINSYETLQEVAPGSIKKLSVAVVIDKSLDSKQQKVIEDMVKSAVGFESARGDQISVAGMPFSTADQDAMNQAIAQAEKQKQMMIYGGIAALALLVIGGILANSVNKKRRTRETELPLGEAEANVGEELASMKHIPVSRQEIPAPESELTPEEKELLRRKEQVEKVAKDHPGDVAQLLRTWLAEE